MFFKSNVSLKKELHIEFSDKDDKILLLAIIGVIYSSVHSTIDYTILSTIDNLKVFAITIVIFILTIVILKLTKVLKKHTIVSLVTLFIVDYILLSTHLMEIQHFFLSKEIEFQATVTKLHQVSLKEEFKDMGVIYDKFIIQTKNERLNNKQIYDSSHKLYHYIKVGDTLKIKGTISDNIFKATKFYFINKEKQKYYSSMTRYD